MDRRWNEIKQLWLKSDIWLWFLPGLILGVIIGLMLGIASRETFSNVGNFFTQNWFASGIWPEVLSTTVAVILIYQFDKWRDERREKERLKNELLWQVRSKSNNTAISAIDRLRHEGWLEGEKSLLIGANLTGANLAFADLSNANLKGANFTGSNLEGAHLSRANLQSAAFDVAYMVKARFDGTNLENTSFWKTDLRGAFFQFTNIKFSNLKRSNLEHAFINVGSDLSGAYLWGANLTYALIANGVVLSDDTVMPDDTSWSKETQMNRFTDPASKDYFKNEWSPE